MRLTTKGLNLLMMLKVVFIAYYFYFYPTNVQTMKARIITVIALLVILFQMSSCAHRQFPATYHHGNNGQSKFY